MDIWINDDHISLLTEQQVQEICAPLFKELNLIGFEYARVYPDGSRAELSTHSKYLLHSYVVNKYFIDIYTPNLLPDRSGFIFPDDWAEAQPEVQKNKLKKQLQHESQHFNFGNSLCIFKRFPGFCEYYLFFCNQNDSAARYSLLSNFEVLEHFIIYFKYKAHTLIEQAIDNKLVAAWRQETDFSNKKPTVNPCLKKFQIKRYYLENKDTYLTAKEARCIAYLMQGFSMSEIGEKTFTSARTVETHINTIKAKLGCEKKSEIFAVIEENKLSMQILLGIIDAIE